MRLFLAVTPDFVLRVQLMKMPLLPWIITLKSCVRRKSFIVRGLAGIGLFQLIGIKFLSIGPNLRFRGLRFVIEVPDCGHKGPDF